MKLQKLSMDDGREIYEMLQGIAPDDNGFHNPACGMSYEEYLVWHEREYGYDSGKLEDWMVPQTSYWLYDGGRPVGYGRVRHFLNDALRQHSGHIGYAIAKPYRGQGYGNAILALLVDECKALGIRQIQISANTDNLPSNKVILKNGGVLTRCRDGKNFYSIGTGV